MCPTILYLTTLTIFIVNTISQSYNYTDFQQFPISLPKPLQQHISAVWNGKLFIIGGKNGSSDSTFVLSPNAWSLDLYALNLTLSSSKNDIDTASINTQSWVSLNISPPTYGLASTYIRCDSQCYTQIGRYLYIIAPYFSDSDTPSTFMYRLDLQPLTPTWASATDIVSDLGSSGAGLITEGIIGPCITSSADGENMYLIGGNVAGDHAEKFFFQYSVSQNQLTAYSFIVSVNSRIKQ